MVRISLAIAFLTFAVVIVVGIAGGGGFRVVVIRGLAAAFFGFVAGLISLGIGWSFLKGLAGVREAQPEEKPEGAE